MIRKAPLFASGASLAGVAAAALIGASLVGASLVGISLADPPPPVKPEQMKVNGKYTGYTYADPDTRKMQDDDFANPGFLWVQDGLRLWQTKEGAAGKSCADCHNKAEDSMKTAGATYPKFQEKLGKMQNVEERVNQCRVDNMQAEPWKWESRELVGMTAYVRSQSRGQPINVSVEGPARKSFENGEKLFYTRHGQLDLSCANCHEDNSGNWIRGDNLGQAQANGFPTYRLKEQRVVSLQFRLIGCVRDTRAEAYPFGSDEYRDIELYLAHRGKGLPVEAPSVRR